MRRSALQVVALVAPPEGAAAGQDDARQEQGEEQRPGNADDALDAGDEAANAGVPRPHQAGLGQRAGRGAGVRSLTVTVSVEYDVWLVRSCS